MASTRATHDASLAAFVPGRAFEFAKRVTPERLPSERFLSTDRRPVATVAPKSPALAARVWMRDVQTWNNGAFAVQGARASAAPRVDSERVRAEGEGVEEGVGVLFEGVAAAGHVEAGDVAAFRGGEDEAEGNAGDVEAEFAKHGDGAAVVRLVLRDVVAHGAARVEQAER